MPTNQRTKVSDLTFHSAVNMVPEMRPAEYAEFLADIRERGIQVPLDVRNGIVLDGRHRLRAARELGILDAPVREVDLEGETEIGYVVKMALLRRHLSDDQRAAMAALWKRQHARPEGRPRKKNSHSGVEVSAAAESMPAAETPQMFNLSRRKVDEATYLLNRAPEKLAQVHRGEARLKEALRSVRLNEERLRIETMPIVDGKFSVIVADPPWPYEVRSNDASHRGTIPYPAMTVEEIKALSVPAADDCALWLWTTNAFMKEAYEVVEAWGFQPKTILTWAKDRMGLGNWLRNQTEHCLVAVRGRVNFTLTNQTTLLHAPVGEHSEKPAEFFRLVEAVCPAPSRVELFARTQRVGWMTHGAAPDVAEKPANETPTEPIIALDPLMQTLLSRTIERGFIPETMHQSAEAIAMRAHVSSLFGTTPVLPDSTRGAPILVVAAGKAHSSHALADAINAFCARFEERESGTHFGMLLGHGSVSVPFALPEEFRTPKAEELIALGPMSLCERISEAAAALLMQCGQLSASYRRSSPKLFMAIGGNVENPSADELATARIWLLELRRHGGDIRAVFVDDEDPPALEWVRELCEGHAGRVNVSDVEDVCVAQVENMRTSRRRYAD